MEHKIKYIAKLRVSDTQTPLLEFILSHVPDIPRKTAKQWLSTGAVYVNGESQKKFDFTLYKDDSVLVRAGKISSSNVMRQQYSFGSSSVGMVYEDEDIIVIDKPYGMSTLSFQTEKQKKAVDTSTLTALSTILQYLNKRNPKKQNKLYVVHVLDKVIDQNFKRLFYFIFSLIYPIASPLPSLNRISLVLLFLPKLLLQRKRSREPGRTADKLLQACAVASLVHSKVLWKRTIASSVIKSCRATVRQQRVVTIFPCSLKLSATTAPCRQPSSTQVIFRP